MAIKLGRRLFLFPSSMNSASVYKIFVGHDEASPASHSRGARIATVGVATIVLHHIYWISSEMGRNSTIGGALWLHRRCIPAQRWRCACGEFSYTHRRSHQSAIHIAKSRRRRPRRPRDALHCAFPFVSGNPLRVVSCIVRQFAAMATAASCALATSTGVAVVASPAARNHSASARPCSKASFVNSELFSSNVGLSARTVGASHPVSVRRSSVLVVCGKVNKGDIVPPVGLKDQDGKLVNLDKYRGKPLVLYFYPADETPGCTKQACAFRDSYEKFKRAGAEVVGVSGDTPESHKAFKAKYRLPFTLLSDEGNKLRKDWGIPSDFFGSLAGRQTYVIDKDGKVQLIFNNQFEPEKHIVETLSILQG